jgi:undecaprenyl diphosphate synthase
LSSKLSSRIKKKIDTVTKGGKIPQHIAIIMDGNGRWAKKRGLPRVAGHKKGVETVREIVETCSELEVKNLTLYTFSTENWKRPEDEVSTLMRLIVKSLQDETDELHKNNIRLNSFGDVKALPAIVQEELKSALKKTENNTRLNLNLALSYSGRWEILNATKAICKEYKEGEIELEDIDEKLFNKHLTTKFISDPDLLIRSGGEFRISNFLLWQIAYSEIYITNVLWPEFNSDNLLDAIIDFQRRERRFGLVSEQISKSHSSTQNETKLSKKMA